MSCYVYQTCPSCDFADSSTSVFPKLVRAVIQIKVAIMSYYSQYFAKIAHNIEQYCGFRSALPPEKLHIIPGGYLIHPQFGNHCST